MRDHNRDRNWKVASEECLVAALDRAKELAKDAADYKSLESLIKTVGDIVGVGGYLARGSARGSGSDGGDDE